MHSGCSGSFDNGRQVVDKLRMMGYSEGGLPIPFEIACECNHTFEMDTFESKCPNCGMVYGVTPCSSHDQSLVKAAGINY